MPDNKMDIKLNKKQSDYVLSGVDWLIAHRMAKDITDAKYIEEVLPKSVKYSVRIFEVYVIDATIKVRLWIDKIAAADPSAKAYIYKVSILGFVLIMSSKTGMKWLASQNIANGKHLDPESIEQLIDKIFPDAEVVK
jgi:hypothetical protein